LSTTRRPPRRPEHPLARSHEHAQIYATHAHQLGLGDAGEGIDNNLVAVRVPFDERLALGVGQHATIVAPTVFGGLDD
jgi:hypothetical protein